MFRTKNLKINNTTLALIKEENLEVYINLARAYEAEFSNLTGKMPNDKGIFEPDTLPSATCFGYLLYNNRVPIGFCLAEINNEVNDIAEFYIIPAMRQNKFGQNLATTIFDMHPGKWQVRQINGADNAIKFWRRVLSEYTQQNYTESIVDDHHWGKVTRQQFVTNTRKISNDKKISYVEELSLHGIFPSNYINKETASIEITKISENQP